MTELRYVYPVDPEGVQCIPNMRTGQGPRMFDLAHQFRPHGTETVMMLCGRCLLQASMDGLILYDPRADLTTRREYAATHIHDFVAGSAFCDTCDDRGSCGGSNVKACEVDSGTCSKNNVSTYVYSIGNVGI